jgi:hypothetical protein
MTALEERRLLSVSAHLRILDNETTIQTGQSVHVTALGSKHIKGTDFGSGDAITSRFQWDFGDPKASYNRLPGFNAAHVYETPGKYKLSLKVTNAKGEVGAASAVIRVVAAHRRAIYVNPWGNDKNDGKTPDTAVASVKRATELLGNNTEILFRNKMKFAVGNPISIPFKNVLIGSYGKGKPASLVLRPNGNQYKPMFVLTKASHQVRIENLALSAAGKSPFGDAIHTGGSNIVIHHCGFANLDSAMVGTNAPTGVLAYDNRAETLRSYFSFVRGSDQVYLGNVAGDSTKQHNIRIYGSRILCYKNDLTNLPNGASLATLRVNDGSAIYWANNTLHGGQMYVGPLGPASAGSSPKENVNTVVIENNRWKEVMKHWSMNDRLRIDAGSANIMVRNNIIDATNSTAINVATSLPQTFGKKTVNRVVKDLQILSNTVVNPGKSGAFLSVGGGAKDVITLKNSLYVAPDLQIGANAAAAVRVSGRDDLLNFTSLSSGGGIDGNVWNLPRSAKSMGVNYVSAKPAGVSAYRTPAEWVNSFPGRVGHDSFEKLLTRDLTKVGTPPAKSTAATFAKPTQGVFDDLIGNARPKKKWTAGAVQANA